jgi:hypothetical protein
MTAQQRKTTTKGAEGLNGENGCKEISDCPLFTNDDNAKGNSSYTAAFFGH